MISFFFALMIFFIIKRHTTTDTRCGSHNAMSTRVRIELKKGRCWDIKRTTAAANGTAKNCVLNSTKATKHLSSSVIFIYGFNKCKAGSNVWKNNFQAFSIHFIFDSSLILFDFLERDLIELSLPGSDSVLANILLLFLPCFK